MNLNFVQDGLIIAVTNGILISKTLSVFIFNIWPFTLERLIKDFENYLSASYRIIMYMGK